MKNNKGKSKERPAIAARVECVAIDTTAIPRSIVIGGESLGRLAELSYAQQAAWMKENEPKFTFDGPHFDDSEESKLHQFIWKCINEPGLPFISQPGTTWRDCAPEVLHGRLQETLQHLIYLANTDTKAIQHLVECIVSTTEFLNGMPAEKLRPVARQNYLWPFLVAKKGKSGDQNKLKCLIDSIQLGRDMPFSEKAINRISASRPAAKEAMRLLCQLEASRKPIVGNSLVNFTIKYNLREWEREAARLEPFSHDTWREWANVAIKSLLDEHDGHPEKNRALREIGQSGASHSFQQGAQKRVTPKTRDANIRQRIVDSIRDVIRTLADSPRKPRKSAV